MYNITMEELKFEVDFILDSCVTEVYEYFFIFFMLDRHLRILESCNNNPGIWSDTLKQFVGNSQRIF